MRGHDLLSISFRIVAAIFIGVGATVALGTFVFVGRAVPVRGIVVDYEVEQNAITFLQGDDPGGVLYYPIVEYRVRGEEHRVTGRAGRTDREYSIGEEIAVLVSPSEPGRSRLNTVLGVWGSAIILGGLGALFLALSVFAPLGFGGRERGKG